MLEAFNASQSRDIIKNPEAKAIEIEFDWC